MSGDAAPSIAEGHQQLHVPYAPPALDPETLASAKRQRREWIPDWQYRAQFSAAPAAGGGAGASAAAADGADAKAAASKASMSKVELAVAKELKAKEKKRKEAAKAQHITREANDGPDAVAVAMAAPRAAASSADEKHGKLTHYGIQSSGGTGRRIPRPPPVPAAAAATAAAVDFRDFYVEEELPVPVLEHGDGTSLMSDDADADAVAAAAPATSADTLPLLSTAGDSGYVDLADLEHDYEEQLMAWRSNLSRHRATLLFDALLTREYFVSGMPATSIPIHCFEAVMSRASQSHRTGHLLCQTRSPAVLWSIGKHIARDYELPRGFDTLPLLTGRHESVADEHPVHRIERMIICFLHGLMPRLPRATSDGRQPCRNAALLPLLSMRPSSLKLYGGRDPAHNAHHVRSGKAPETLFSWLNRLLARVCDVYLTSDDVRTLSVTCRALNVRFADKALDQQTFLSACVPPGVRLPPTIDGLVIKCFQRLHWRARAPSRAENPNDDPELVFAACGVRLRASPVVVTELKRDAFDAALWYFATARLCIGDVLSLSAERGIGSAMANLFRDCQEWAASPVTHTNIDGVGTTVVISTSVCTATLRPVIALARTGMGRCSADAVCASGWFPYLALVDVTRGVCWSYGLLDPETVVTTALVAATSLLPGEAQQRAIAAAVPGGLAPHIDALWADALVERDAYIRATRQELERNRADPAHTYQAHRVAMAASATEPEDDSLRGLAWQRELLLSAP